MRTEFPGYYRPTQGELTELWKDCVFIFDTNVLLGLYRYPKQAYDDLIGVIKHVSNRVWIPHQVALEYQENRLGVIAEQVGKYSEVSKILASTQTSLSKDLESLQLKKRHSSIDPDDFLRKIGLVFKEFESELDALRKTQPDVSDDDEIRDELDAIFQGKVGQAFSATELDSLYAEGKTRYEMKRPPGYLDKGKSKQDEDYNFNGLIIKREYGDFIVWRQTIREAQSRKLSHVIFVTDDDKDDWWWTKSGKTIGPRPELVEEILREAGVSMFYMYTSARFLKYAKEFLGIHVEQESINQVREISRLRNEIAHTANRQSFAFAAEKAVYEWLQNVYPKAIIIASQGFPDFEVLHDDSRLVGFEVKSYRNLDSMHIRRRLQEFREQASLCIVDRKFSEVTLIFVTSDKQTTQLINGIIMQTQTKYPYPGISAITGILVPSNEEGGLPSFVPVNEMNADNSGILF